MAVMDEIRRRFRQIAAPVLGAVVLAYFCYHTVQGDRGLLAYHRVSQEVARAQTALDAVREERLQLEHRAGLLRADSLDLDMLEERARALFNHVHADELLIYEN